MATAVDYLADLCAILTELGHTVQTLAAVAPAQIPSLQPDLVLIDLTSLGEDGYRYCEDLRQVAPTATLPVIVTSHTLAMLDKPRLFAAGAQDYWVAPFLAAEVRARLTPWLGYRRLERQLATQGQQLQQEVHDHQAVEATLQRQLHHTLLLKQITQEIRQSLDIDQIFQTAVVQIGQALQVNRCLIHAYSAHLFPPIMPVAEYLEPDIPSAMGWSIPLRDNPYVEAVLAHDQAIAAAQVETDPLLQQVASVYRPMALKSLLTVRTSYKGDANGMIGVHQCNRERLWRAEEIELLESVAAQVGIAIAQAQLLDQEKRQRLELDQQNLQLQQEIRERQRMDAILKGHNHILEMIAQGVPLTTVFAALAEFIEGWSEQARCSFHLFDADRGQLIAGVAPSLPPAFTQAIATLPIGPQATSSGAAAYYKRAITAQAIATDPIWADWRDLALAEGLQACWAMPLLSADEDVLGTFALYYQHPHAPSSKDQDLIPRVAYLAKVAIERHRSEQTYREIFEASYDGFIVYNIETGAILDVNQRVCELYGFSREELLQLHFHDLNRGLAADAQADLLAWVRKAPAGEICTFECQSQRADGDRFWSEVILKSAVIGGKKRLLSIERDISDRKRTETDLQQAKEAAEAANRAKSTFLANMSHELRTPLNAILGFAQLLAYDPHLNAEQKEELMIISRSGEHLLELINDILDLSKIEAGRLTLNESCFNLHRFLDGLEKMLQLKAESKGLQFIFQIDPNLPAIVQTDESKLRQVLINLLGNAIKFTEQGQVVLRVWAEYQSFGPPPANQNSAVCVHPHGTAADPDLPSPVTYYLSFAVEDTGHGIAPAELASLFNAFVQTETGRRSQQGSGLGLAISRQFVQLMGGEISVQSQLGQGSCFYFYIPVSVTEATALPIERPLVRTQEARVTLSAEERCYRMLVVDDHWESRKLLVKLLDELGFEVREAINGEEAIGRWQHWHPHLIWMDVRMPDMSGYEVTQRIRRREQRQQHQPHATPMSQDPHPATATCVAPPRPPATKIIALTASAFSDEHTQALAAGCDDLIRKPFRRATVLEKLHQHLGVQFFETTASLPDEEVSLESASPASQATPSLAAQSTRECLQTMPNTWIESLRQAAMQVNARKLMKLIEAVPPEQAALAQVLTEMVDNFRFDQIIDLSTMAQPHGKSTS
ncbi:response regulator [Trichothermofontia sp.]